MTRAGEQALIILTTSWLYGLVLGGIVLAAASRCWLTGGTLQLALRASIVAPAAAAAFLTAMHLPNAVTGFRGQSADLSIGPVAFSEVRLPSAGSEFGLRGEAFHLIIAAMGWTWIAFIAGCCLVLFARRVALKRLLRRFPLAESACLPDLVALSREHQYAGPKLLLDGGSQGPFAAPGGIIVLPSWALQASPEQRRVIVLHEVRHLMRLDTRWNPSLTLICTALMLPFRKTLLRQLGEIAEHDCDGWAAAQHGSGRPLAEALVTCAVHALPRLGASAPGMTSPGPLAVERVQRLLGGTAMPLPKSGILSASLAAVFTSASIAALPNVSLATDAAQTRRADGPSEHGFVTDASGRVAHRTVTPVDLDLATRIPKAAPAPINARSERVATHPSSAVEWHGGSTEPPSQAISSPGLASLGPLPSSLIELAPPTKPTGLRPLAPLRTVAN